VGAAVRLAPLVSALLVGSTNFVTFGLAGWISGGPQYGRAYAAANGLAFGLAGFLCCMLGAWRRPARAQFQLRHTARRFVVRFTSGILIGAAFARVVGQPSVLPASITVGLALGSSAWLNVRAHPSEALSPSLTLRQDRTGTIWFGLAAGSALGILGGLTVAAPASGQRPGTAVIAFSMLICASIGASLVAAGYSLICGLVYGLAGAMVGFLATGPAIVTGAVHGLAYGITFGFSIALAVIAPRAWGSFTITRALLALTGRLPWRLTTFLDDAANRGALRQAGDTYKFRHLDLQRCLARANPSSPRITGIVRWFGSWMNHGRAVARSV
jgi:hypothetical protein